tara:strand:+ start:44 stop:1513 length:1470 start_codon:yes stop_codon:yes gene_type:complete
MATTITQKPNQLAAAYSPMVFVLSESSSAIYDGFKFRYIVQVFIDDVEKAKLKLHKNASNDCVVDISKIVKTYLETQENNLNSTANSIHNLGISAPTKNFSQNTSQICKVTVKAGHEVATSATTAPSETLAEDTETIYAIPATTPYANTATNVGGLDDSDNSFPLTYFINDDTSEDDYSFLTNAPTVQFVRGSSTSGDNVDELTICFKQGKNSSGSILTVGEKIEYIAIQYFNSAGTLIAGTVGSETTHFFTNSNATGGATSAEANTVQESILYFGCGTKNLQTSSSEVKDSDGNVEASGSARPSNFSNWAYYRIFGCTNHDTTDRCTKYYYFYRYGSGATVDDRHQSCTKYDNVRLAWRNRLGAWDYFNFRGKSIESLDIKKETMSSVAGTWDSTTFNYNNWDRGTGTLYTEANRKLTINSDWLNEDEAVWLEELFTSINVQILADNNIVYPVILTDKSYIKKTSVNNKIKIQYTIKLEYANKVRTNS